MALTGTGQSNKSRATARAFEYIVDECRIKMELHAQGRICKTRLDVPDGTAGQNAETDVGRVDLLDLNNMLLFANFVSADGSASRRKRH